MFAVPPLLAVKFLHDENLKLLHKRLTERTDEKQRQVRHSLIAE
jgi:hypothetical protein